MKYVECQSDLFTAPEEYYLAHCISSDFVMGAGIAPQFTAHFGTKQHLLERYPNFEKYFLQFHPSGYCIQDGRVFNLITKHLVYEKPTMDTVRGALNKMRELILEEDIHLLAMPKIACGIDGLNWTEVSQLIQEIFNDVDISIVICYL